MKKRYHSYLILTILVLFLLFEFWIFRLAHQDTALPDNLGNFPEKIARLQSHPTAEKFRFFIVGDTRSEGTFIKLAEALRGQKIDFGVLLGDIAFRGNCAEHRWLREELSSDWKLHFPLFYLIGNHDISDKNFPVKRFEQEYGPSIFSFVYQNCLFIFLRVWNHRGEDYQDSLNFLRQLSKEDLSHYRQRFVFMHQPPPVPTVAAVTHFTTTDTFNELFRKMHIDYVFAADFHGYSWTSYQGINYTISGGGGAKLASTNPKQFYHAIICEVGRNYVSREFIVVNKDFRIEAHLERLAFVCFMPFYHKHRVLVVLINIAVTVSIITILRRLFNPNNINLIGLPGAVSKL